MANKDAQSRNLKSKEVLDQQPSLEEKILLGLSKVGQALRIQEQKRSLDEHLSATQSQVLILVSQNVRTPSEIADRLKISRASLSDSLASLVEKNLVRKRNNPQDSRSSLLELTPKGRRRSEMMSQWPDILLDSVQDLSVLEKATLLKTVSKVIMEMQKRDLVSVPGMCVTCRFFKPNAHPGEKKNHHCAYVDAAFSDAELRLSCSEQQPA